MGGAPDISGKTELYSYRVRTRGTATIVPLLSPPSVQPIGRHYLACVEPSPKTNLIVYWPGEICLLHLCDSMCPPHPTHKFSLEILLPGNQPHPTLSARDAFCSNQQTSVHVPQETLSVAGNQPWTELWYFLNKFWGSTSQRWKVASLGMI